MCIALQEMMADSRAEGMAEGMAKGRAEGRTEGIASVIGNLMQNMGLSVSQAMDALSIPQEERDMYTALIDH